MKSKEKVQFGDFQTPLPLAEEVCSWLKERGLRPDVILEPTCGIGSFLRAAATGFPDAGLIGWEISSEYLAKTQEAMKEVGAAGRTTLVRRDLFDNDWPSEIAKLPGHVLILGNPPWVTNAAVCALNGSNLPHKENFLGLRGMEARTGKSNFDISEWMLVRLLQALRGRSATLALLCKTATARKVLRFGWQNDARIKRASLHLIDAKRYFGATVNACLLYAELGETGPCEAELFDKLSTPTPRSVFGLAGRDMVSDVRAYSRLRVFEGLCPYRWRSGVKHDCADVMELSNNADGVLRNKVGEEAAVEPDYIFPLLKCSDLANGRCDPKRFVLVPQRFVGEETNNLKDKAPALWKYLTSHLAAFDARKSSVYHDQFPFSIFGVGPYSFAAWKVAVSGLHRNARFALVGPVDGKPVFFDDTCYFLPFAEKAEAEVVTEILNSSVCTEFLEALTFPDAKRPITVDLLQRLNIYSIAQRAGLAVRWQNERRL